MVAGGSRGRLLLAPHRSQASRRIMYRRTHHCRVPPQRCPPYSGRCPTSEVGGGVNEGKDRRPGREPGGHEEGHTLPQRNCSGHRIAWPSREALRRIFRRVGGAMRPKRPARESPSAGQQPTGGARGCRERTTGLRHERLASDREAQRRCHQRACPPGDTPPCTSWKFEELCGWAGRQSSAAATIRRPDSVG